MSVLGQFDKPSVLTTFVSAHSVVPIPAPHFLCWWFRIFYDNVLQSCHGSIMEMEQNLYQKLKEIDTEHKTYSKWHAEQKNS